MTRNRLRALIALSVSLAAATRVHDAQAAAEIHRLNLVLSANPSWVDAKDFNRFIEDFNRASLEPFGIEGLHKITFSWVFDAQLHYFVRPNVAVSAGVGQLRKQSKREILPGIQQDIQIRAEILSAPIHVGGAYYLQPYNQGDFQARAYFGAGFMSLIHNRGRIQFVTAGAEQVQSFEVSGKGDSPGYYVETGAHMFFAARYSVLLGLIYRSAKVRDMEGEFQTPTGTVPLGPVFDLDTSGVGARMSLAIGF